MTPRSKFHEKYERDLAADESHPSEGQGMVGGGASVTRSSMSLVSFGENSRQEKIKANSSATSFQKLSRKKKFSETTRPWRQGRTGVGSIQGGRSSYLTTP